MDRGSGDGSVNNQGVDDSKLQCPTCGRSDFASKQGMKAHHARTHGEKLVEISEDELIHAMRSLGGDAPTREQMRVQGEYSPKKYERMFGSWNEALIAAGYEPRTASQTILQSELLQSLESLADQLGRSPTQSDINEHSEHSHKTYYRKFDGGLEEAKRRLGLEHYDQLSKTRFTVNCANCGTEVEKTPSELAASDFHYCSQECHYEHKKERYSGRGNPQSTLEKVPCESCGEMIDRPQWKREKNEKHYCSDCWGDAKVAIECEQCREIERVWPSAADKRRFCSYECMGEWRGEEITGQDHPRFREGYRPGYYGPNWDQQRRDAIVRDQARCRDCGLTEAQSMEQFGEGLSVHHITPVRDFLDEGELDYQQANQVGNLVSLCRPCHSKRETEAEQHGF